MHLVSTLITALTCAAAAAYALPTTSSNSPMRLAKRQGHCHTGMVEVLAYNNKLVCVGERTVWIGAAITAIGQGTIQTVASRVTDWIASSVTWKMDTSQGRLARRDTQASDGTLFVTVGGAEIEVPFVQGAEDKLIINLLDVFASSLPVITSRAVSEADVTLSGGTATYHSNGTLDNFTLDFAIPSSSYVSTTHSNESPALLKRSYWTLHTTYWADYQHASTSLNWNDIHSMVLTSYGSLPSGVSQVCGYLANSGSWHGAFRHWTGDAGYQVGDCKAERTY